MSKILFIGGTRFFGPAIIRKLLREDGHEITIFNRGNEYGHKIPNVVKHIKGDRLRKEDLSKISPTKYDYIYDMCCFNPEEAKLLLKQLRPQSHIIFFSSAAVYEKTIVYPLYESSKLGQWPTFGDYGECKAKIEEIYSTYCRKHNLKFTALRPNYLLGKNNYFDRENYFFSRILKNRPILIPGTGDSIQQFGFLEDTAEAFFLIPKKQKSQTEFVNIAGNELISIKNFIMLCGKIAEKKPILISIKNGQFGIEEESFYDDLYPFPNVTFITSNKVMVEKYGIKPTELTKGLKMLYKHWRKQWNGKVHIYKLEEKLLNKLKKHNEQEG